MFIKIDATDVMIIGLWAFFVYLGYKNGLFKGILHLTGFVFSLTLSLLLVPFLAKFFHFVLELKPNVSVLLGFTFLFAVTMLLYVFFMAWIHETVQMTVKGWFNRATGVFFGLIRGLLIVSLLTIGFSLMPPAQLVSATEKTSSLFVGMRVVLPCTYDYGRRLIPGIPTFKESLRSSYKKIGDIDGQSHNLMKNLPENCKYEKQPS